MRCCYFALSSSNVQEENRIVGSVCVCGSQRSSSILCCHGYCEHHHSDLNHIPSEANENPLYLFTTFYCCFQLFLFASPPLLLFLLLCVDHTVHPSFTLHSCFYPSSLHSCLYHNILLVWEIEVCLPCHFSESHFGRCFYICILFHKVSKKQNPKQNKSVLKHLFILTVD